MAKSHKKPPKIKLKPVKSSAIAELGRDPVTGTLAIKFSSGHMYHSTTPIAPEDHSAFEAAESVGSHYHRHIRGKFDFVRVHE